MRDLLSAGCARLWRCKTFWLCCAVMSASGALPVLALWRENVELGYSNTVDSGFFRAFPVVAGFLLAVVCAFLIGPEYSDGTIRNKIAVGRGRRDVYLANLAVCSLASILMCAFAAVPALALGLPLLGGFHMGAVRAGVMAAGVFCLSLSWTAIFTLVMMLVDRRPVATALVLTLPIVLLLLGAYVYNRLDAEPTVTGYVVSVNGELGQYKPEPNPSFIPDGPKRKAFELLNDILPGGQTIQYADMSAKRPELLIAWDAAVVLVCAAVGTALFKRKDIK